MVLSTTSSSCRIASPSRLPARCSHRFGWPRWSGSGASGQQDLGAYGYTMRAMPRVWALEKQEAERALALLDKALEIDPDYPLALALAAWCWAQRSVYSWVTNVNDAKTRALSLGERAATLSNDEPLILAVLGAVHTFARNFGTARVLLERAVALDPNAAWALSRLGWLEVYSGRPEAAHAYFERALRLSPLDPMNFNNHVGIASAFQVAGHPARAADEFLRALHERPNALWIHRILAPALLAAGREEEAKASRDALTAAYPDFTIASFKEAMVLTPTRWNGSPTTCASWACRRPEPTKPSDWTSVPARR